MHLLERKMTSLSTSKLFFVVNILMKGGKLEVKRKASTQDGSKEPPWLTPKIPSVFLPNSAVSDLLGRIHFSTKKSMRN
jgi:hypothetical protein